MIARKVMTIHGTEWWTRVIHGHIHSKETFELTLDNGQFYTKKITKPKHFLYCNAFKLKVFKMVLFTQTIFDPVVKLLYLGGG